MKLIPLVGWWGLGWYGALMIARLIFEEVFLWPMLWIIDVAHRSGLISTDLAGYVAMVLIMPVLGKVWWVGFFTIVLLGAAVIAGASLLLKHTAPSISENRWAAPVWGLVLMLVWGLVLMLVLVAWTVVWLSF